jgi:hypothetical protein
MTTYAYRLTLHDGECIALQKAIELYMEKCRSELSQGAGAPYWAHLRDLESIEARLNSDAVMTSTNDF